MRRCRIQAGIHIIQIRAKLCLRLRIHDSVVQSVDERNRVSAIGQLISPVLEDPETVAVVVGSEVSVFRVDSGAGAAVEIDDDVEFDGAAVVLDMVVEGVEGVGGEAGRFGDSDGFGEESLVLDRKSTRLNSSHSGESRMPSSA